MVAVAYTIELEGVAGAFDKASDHLEELLPVALQLVGDLVAQEAKTTHEYTDRSGLLTQSIQRGPVVGSFRGGDLSIDVTAGGVEGIEYARYVEMGTGPHLIKAKNAKALQIPTGDGYIYRKQVMHPGTRPYYFLRGAIERTTQDAARILQDAAQLALHRAGFRS